MQQKGLMIILLGMLLLGACQPSVDEPVLVPTRVNQAEIAATWGVPPEEVIAQTQTARAPTATDTATPLTPTATVPTATASDTASLTFSPTATINPIQGTETRVFELTLIAQTATAPSYTPTITDTPSITPSITPTASNTLSFVPEVPDNPAPNVVLFTSNRGQSNDIWLMTINGEPSRPLVNAPNSDENMVACDPRGEILIFETDRDGERRLYRSDYDGTSLSQLSDDGEEAYQPIWSPTGEYLAFVSDRLGDANIWILNRNGDNLRQISIDPGRDMHPSWSADGNVLFYTSNRGESFDIYQYNLVSDEESRVTDTPDIDELYPVLSPDFQTIAYVAEDGGNLALFTLDSNGFVQKASDIEGDILQPQWVDERQMLVSAVLEPNNQQVVLLDTLGIAEARLLTTIGSENQWPRYCYVEEGFLATLPEVRPTPILRPTIPTATPVTPTLTATTTPSPTLTPLAFNPNAQPEENWLISTETWTGDEVAFVARELLPEGASGFIADETLNLTWQDAEGQHVLTFVLEAFRGELVTTIVGYTVNDLPAFPGAVAGIELELDRLILQNSIRSDQYSLTDISFTDVNFTLNFRVPATAPRFEGSEYALQNGDLPANWLISTERWSATELSILATLSGVDNATSAVFVGDQVQYRWQNDEGVHVLLVRFSALEGDLVVNPVSYTINESAEDVVPDIINRIREGVLVNSIPPGGFFLSRVEPDVGAFTLVFVVPPLIE